MGKLHGYLRLMRPINCLMMSSAVIVGAALASSYNISTLRSDLIYGLITGFTLTAASMTINDYYDRKIDAINEPKRPIPSGLVKPNEVLSLSLVLMMTGFVAAYITSPTCLLSATVAWLFFVAYTTVGKRSGLPGNFLVSACVAIPFLYGSIVAVGSTSLSILFFAGIVFLSNTGREITKGIVDVQGDKTQYVKTLAVRYGEKSAAVAAVCFYISAVSLSLMPWWLGLVSVWFIPVVAVTDLGLIASSLILLRDYSRENARKVKNRVLIWFIVGLLAFIIGAIR